MVARRAGSGTVQRVPGSDTCLLISVGFLGPSGKLA